MSLEHLWRKLNKKADGPTELDAIIQRLTAASLAAELIDENKHQIEANRIRARSITVNIMISVRELRALSRKTESEAQQ